MIQRKEQRISDLVLVCERWGWPETSPSAGMLNRQNRNRNVGCPTFQPTVGQYVGNAMLPFDCELSKVSAVLPALRTQTPTRKAENASDGVHVQLLLVDQLVCAYHCDPSKTSHLNCCGPTPPVIDAVNVTATPAGDGAVRDEEMPVNISVPPDDVDVDVDVDVEDELLDVIGNEMLPFDAGLS